MELKDLILQNQYMKEKLQEFLTHIQEGIDIEEDLKELIEELSFDPNKIQITFRGNKIQI